MKTQPVYYYDFLKEFIKITDNQTAKELLTQSESQKIQLSTKSTTIAAEENLRVIVFSSQLLYTLKYFRNINLRFYTQMQIFTLRMTMKT